MDGVDITEVRTIADACDDYATVDTETVGLGLRHLAENLIEQLKMAMW